MGEKWCFFMKWLTVEFGTWGQCLSLQDEVFCLFLWYQISTSSRNAVLYCKNRWAQYREWLQPDMEVVQVITVVISTHFSIPLLLEMSFFSENCRVWNEIFMVSVVGFWDDYEWFEIIWFYEKLSGGPHKHLPDSILAQLSTYQGKQSSWRIHRTRPVRLMMKVWFASASYMVLHNTEILLSNMSQFIFRWMGGNPRILTDPRFGLDGFLSASGEPWTINSSLAPAEGAVAATWEWRLTESLSASWMQIWQEGRGVTSNFLPKWC